ncbi:uncharacterized protein LOC117648101 isoform X2 [Thrips palmi]|uniref:Uncharacterized protein LOC117648101 isoform X2 n=1 Tax=Thrips palmi TaxID=161013 RepID=A0A6P8Z168_THRPL|nr:uncharacterized protein LOC117648101 isoform X2 [Thrips palmi]
MKLDWLAILLPALDLVSSKFIPSFAGPYTAFVHTIDACPSDGTFVLQFRPTHFNRARPNERQRVTGNATVKKPVTDNFWSTVNLAVRANNEWKENFFVNKFSRQGCTAIRLHSPELFNLVVKYTGASADKNAPCVIPPGFFVVKDEPISWTFPNFPIMPYGRYRFRGTSRDSETSNITRLCIDVDCEVIPKV